MPSLTQEDVLDVFARVQRLGKELGVNTDQWTLVDGVLGSPGVRRTPWIITENGRRLMMLGFTRRNALDSLAALANGYEAVLRAD
jgi:hypothetical protein